MNTLRQQQPKLHRELCDVVVRLHRVKDALVALPEAYTLRGAVSEMLLLADEAMKEVRESLSDTARRRRPSVCHFGYRPADQALLRALCDPDPDGPATQRIVLPNDQ